MKTTTKKISDTKVELKVVLDATDLQTARSKAIENLAKNLKVQGFRAGKAPASLVEKNLAPNEIASETLDVAVRTTLPQAFTETAIAPIAVEKVDVVKYAPDEMAEYTAKADVLPEIKLGDFTKLKAKKDTTEPTEQEVQEIVDNIINAYAEKKAAKKAAALGDEVIIDFVGKKDDKPFAGGEAHDYHLTLGSGQFIPGFEEGIVGHSAGDKFNLELTFPKDYGEKSLAGQKTVFEVLLKQVNEVVKPKEDDDLAKKCGDFKTMADLRADIKKNLATQNEHRALDKYRDELVGELVKASKVAAPDILIEDQLRFIKDDMSRNAESYGMTFEQYLERAGQTMEEWAKEARKVAEERVKASLVLQVLAREQHISATDEEVEAKIAELKDVYKKSAEAMKSLKAPAVRQDIKNRLTIDKTMEFLISANEGTNKPKTEKKTATKKTTTKKVATKSASKKSDS